eukprot:4677178-Prymnesium_polylepis.1
MPCHRAAARFAHVADDHPVGHGLCGFAIEYIVHQGEAAALHDVQPALDALDEYDAQVREATHTHAHG